MVMTLFLLSKTQIICPSSHIISKKATKNLQNFLVKDLKDQCIGMKTKSEKKTWQKSADIITNHTFQELTDYLCWLIQIKLTILKGIKLEGITCQKYY